MLTDDPNMRFVVEADGTRYIENMSLSIRGQENFDFASSDPIANITADYVQNRMDVSHIGRTVNFTFVDSSPVTAHYGADEFYADVASIEENSTVVPDLEYLLFEVNNILDNLWDDGVSKFIDDEGRPIIYGTASAEALSADPMLEDGRVAQALEDNPYFQDYLGKGVVLVGGGGNDSITGSAKSDILLGGTDNDTLRGSPPPGNVDDKLADYLAGGTGYDTYVVGGSYDDYQSGSGHPFYSIEQYYRTSAWYILGIQRYIDTIYDEDGIGKISATFEAFGDIYEQTLDLDVYSGFVQLPLAPPRWKQF
jgi:hypothetical protein